MQLRGTSSSQRTEVEVTDIDSLLQKRREEKRQRKLSQSQSSFCFEQESLDFIESATQMEARLHSHLLLGRTQNRVLQAFVSEVEKTENKIKDSEPSIGTLLSKSFKKANRSASKVI